ncbi:MAG: PQQ-dependent sugar dehydrogenase [Bacteroidetes bacterium]|nr:PQQ-dependent sugar dehydrogenase [Bacteroidota bacterium]MBS1671013.1 PQQ-dependent sugar dehydrogenase [Bacteroidota bacterium]
MKKYFFAPFLLISINVLAGLPKTDSTKKNITDDNAGLTLPSNFSAIKIADGLGVERHIVVTPQGEVYVKLNFNKRSKYKNAILHLIDTNGDGIMDSIQPIGNYVGTGIAIKNGYLYASSDEEVFRYKLNEKNQIIHPNNPEKIITGLLNRGEHESKSIALDNNGNIYVNIGAYSNSCQEKDRQTGSMGMKPCPILDSAGGIWMFKVDKQNQTYKDGTRYATGLRNVVGLDWNTQTNTLFVMQHGRDQLHDIFPEMFTTKQSAELPAECMYEIRKGDNAGWPYIYYDNFVNKKIIAPEYGGDGKQSTSNYINPAIAFPAHLAPNGLLFYTGNQFPEKYKNGAFIAFHGSWNRAPEPQEGFYVVFVPFKNGKPTGKWEVFANGFAGKTVITSSRDAAHRPCGLAQGADGSLYVSDDAKGTIYKITYNK